MLCQQWLVQNLLILYYNIMMKKSSSQKKMLNLQAFMDQPLIIVSSSESEGQKEIRFLPKVSQCDASGLTLIERKTESKAQRSKRISQITKIFEDLKEKSQLNQQQRQQNAHLISSAQAYKAKAAKQQQLKKQFPSFKNLPAQSLSFVKQQMQKIAHHPKCQFDKNSNQPNSSLRQLHRQNLTKYILLAIQELRVSKGPKTQDEKYLCGKKQQELVEISYKLASQIQMKFYKQLYRKVIKKKGDVYDKQIKIVLKELADKNHVQFRRKIINHSYPLKDLAYAKEDSLVCQKTKQELLEKQRQLVRQNQIIEPKEPQAEEEYYEPPLLRYTESYNSHNSNLEEKKKETIEEKLLQKKQEIVSKNKIIYKKAYTSMAKCFNLMNERINQLRNKGFKQLRQMNFQI